MQTSDRAKNRLAVFAVKLRESFKAYLSDKDEWPTSCYSELLLDTLLEDLTSTEVRELDTWYSRHSVQEQVYSVSYEIATDDKFLQNMMRSVDPRPARTEANLESMNGRSAEFFKMSVLYARRKLITRLSFQTSVIYKGTYGKKIPLSAMDDSCMILGGLRTEDPISCSYQHRTSSWMFRAVCLRPSCPWSHIGQEGHLILLRVALR